MIFLIQGLRCAEASWFAIDAQKGNFQRYSIERIEIHVLNLQDDILIFCPQNCPKINSTFELKITRIFNNRTSYIVIIPYKNTFFDTFINEEREIASVFPRMPRIKRSLFAVGREERDANWSYMAAGRRASFNAYPSPDRSCR
jgi:hypothetical protein